MSKKVILLHIPVYVLAIWGLIMAFLLSTIPQSDRTEVAIRDGKIEYTTLGNNITLGEIISGITQQSGIDLFNINNHLERNDPPRQSAIWLYISLDKQVPNSVVFHDFIFNCPFCHREDIFDMYRTVLTYDMDEKRFHERGAFYRESILLSDYLIPPQGIDIGNQAEARTAINN